MTKEELKIFKLGVLAGRNKTFSIKGKKHSFCLKCEEVKKVEMFYFREDGMLNKKCKKCVCRDRRDRYKPVSKRLKWE